MAIITSSSQDTQFTQAAPKTPMIDLRNLGGQGLMQSAGFITEDLMLELQGQRGVKKFTEMATTDSTCGAILNLYDKLIRQAPMRVESASSAPYDREAADFLESCLEDMDETWTNFVSEMCLTTFTYGHSPHEIVYKRRAGENDLPYLDSHYADGRIGWRSLASRHPSTIQQWAFDDNGRLTGLLQLCPPRYQLITIPYDKMLLFRTSTIKGSPEGQSIFRPCYRSYYMKRGIEQLEGVGLERDAAGIPLIKIPRQLMEDAENGDMAAKKMVAAFKDIAINLRQDAQAGLVIPSEYDEAGKPLFDVSLLQSAGSRQFDSDKIAMRHDRAILRACGADFLSLGDAGGSGSYSMHSSKTQLFLRQTNAYLKMFADELNNRGVRKLMKLNGFRMSDIPRITFGTLDQADLGSLSDALQKLNAAGMPLFPDKELEDYVREVGSLPSQVTGADETEVHPQDPQHLGHVRDLIDSIDSMKSDSRVDEEDTLLR
ncbi:MAG: hypothetical protein EOO38_00335 [Cytophagaceae bacterium]|nr:MAG: hypothetical protein EOO38_00335 [Cytophagaceae bacterium]